MKAGVDGQGELSATHSGPPMKALTHSNPDVSDLQLAGCIQPAELFYLALQATRSCGVGLNSMACCSIWGPWALIDISINGQKTRLPTLPLDSCHHCLALTPLPPGPHHCPSSLPLLPDMQQVLLALQSWAGMSPEAQIQPEA